MKRFIFVLSLVCTVFFGCGVTSALAFKSGDTIDGITLDFSNSDSSYVDYISSCNYVAVMSNGNVYFSKYPFTVKPSYFYLYYGGDSNYLYYRSDIKSISRASSNTIYYSSSEFTYANHDICDVDTGDVFFSVAPPVIPTPTTAPAGATVGVTTEMLLGVLAELKPIILGLIVSVVGFVAFRKAWNWVLTNFIKV